MPQRFTYRFFVIEFSLATSPPPNWNFQDVILSILENFHTNKETKQKQSRIFVLNCIQINEKTKTRVEERKKENGSELKNHKLDVKQKLRI